MLKNKDIVVKYSRRRCSYSCCIDIMTNCGDFLLQVSSIVYTNARSIYHQELLLLLSTPVEYEL
jgi:hypothetical protein